MLEINDIFTRIIDKNILNKSVQQGHLERNKFRFYNFEMNDEDCSSIRRYLRIIQTVATYFIIKKTICD
jgi:ribosomal protein S6